MTELLQMACNTITFCFLGTYSSNEAVFVCWTCDRRGKGGPFLFGQGWRGLTGRVASTNKTSETRQQRRPRTLHPVGPTPFCWPNGQVFRRRDKLESRIFQKRVPQYTSRSCPPGCTEKFGVRGTAETLNET